MVEAPVIDLAEIIRIRVNNITARYDDSYLLDIFNIAVQAVISCKTDEVLTALENYGDLRDGALPELRQTKNLLMAYRHLFGISGPQPIQIPWPYN